MAEWKQVARNNVMYGFRIRPHHFDIVYENKLGIQNDSQAGHRFEHGSSIV